MLLKLLIYLEGNWENICKTRGICSTFRIKEIDIHKLIQYLGSVFHYLFILKQQTTIIGKIKQ